MANNSIYERLCDIIAQQFNLDTREITPNTTLEYDLGLESLDILEYVVLVQHEFDIDIPDSILPELKTVQDVVNYIEETISDGK